MLKVFMGRILGYNNVGGLHSLIIGGLNIFMGGILGYIDVGGLHALVIGGLNVCGRYFRVYSCRWVSRRGYRRVKYFYGIYFRVY